MNFEGKEIRKFDEIGRIWWDPKGEMGSLHRINPLRMVFIREKLDLRGCRILDVGCGGGILAEALAEAGAQVTGIDLSQVSLLAAREHAMQRGLNIDYQYVNLEDIARKIPESFDAVTCMEMLEHVPIPSRIVAACAVVLKPGGQLFCSTINRTPKAWLFAIVGGEYILHILPKGSHQYKHLIRPAELKSWAGKNNMVFKSSASLTYNIITRKFALVAGKEDVNYLMHFIRQ